MRSESRSNGKSYEQQYSNIGVLDCTVYINVNIISFYGWWQN